MNTKNLIRKNAQILAQRLLDDPSAVILDVETTGVRSTAKPVQIGVIDMAGNVLFEVLINPGVKMPDDAAAITGITDDMLAGQPAFEDVAAELDALLTGKTIVAYNEAFDRRILNSAFNGAGVTSIVPAMVEKWECAMKLHDAFNYHTSLQQAAADLGVTVQGDAHSAVSDCLTVLGMLQKMAALDMGKPYAMPDANGVTTLYLTNGTEMKLPGQGIEDAETVGKKWNKPEKVKPTASNAPVDTDVDDEEIAAKKAELDEHLVALARLRAKMADELAQLEDLEKAAKGLYLDLYRADPDGLDKTVMTIGKRVSLKYDPRLMVQLARSVAPELIVESIDEDALKQRIELGQADVLAGFYEVRETVYARFNPGALSLLGM